MDLEKVDAILRWSVPKNLHELQVFLLMSGFYRQYVKDYAKISIPMTDRLRSKPKKISWGRTQQRSFEKLKVTLATAPVLDIVHLNESFVLETDASVDAYKRELLAIVHALKKWHHYLYGATFEVRTDHDSLKWLSNHKGLTGRKARWAQILQDFDL